MSFNAQEVKFLEQTTRAMNDISNQLTELPQALSVSELDKFSTQPNQNSLGQCFGEELSSSDTIGHNPV